MSSVSETLRAAGACGEAVEWAESYEDPAEAWGACADVEWLCWWIDRCGDTPARHALIADFALDCLAIYERHVPGDRMVRDCIQARRAYSRGELTKAQWDAARSAIWDAARAEARAAAGDAASGSARAAVWAASRDAARAAVWSASRDAARAAARAAVLDAVLDASWDAACAAGWAAGRGEDWESSWERQRLIILQHYPTPPTLEGVR